MSEVPLLQPASQLGSNNGTRGNTASINSSGGPILNINTAQNGGVPPLFGICASNLGPNGLPQDSETIVTIQGVGDSIQGSLVFVRAKGIANALTAVTAESLIGVIAGAGSYVDSNNVAQIGAGCCYIEFRATEDFTATSQGTNMCVYLNQTGQSQPTHNSTLMLRLQDNILGVSGAYSCNSQVGLTRQVIIPNGPTLTFTGGILTGVT